VKVNRVGVTIFFGVNPTLKSLTRHMMSASHDLKRPLSVFLTKARNVTFCPDDF
jgi:hypothetical protein